MVALTTYQGTTELATVIPSEEIDTFVAAYPYIPSSGVALAWTRPGRGNVAVKFQKWDLLDSGSGVPAGTKAETDVFTDVDLHTSESSVTPGIVGFRLAISDEAVAGNIIGAPASSLIECIRALDERMDADIHAVAASATNTTGAFTDTMTLENFRAAVTAYKALELGPGPHAAILGHTAASQLLASIHTGAATLLRSAGDTIDLRPIAGFLGTLHGMQIFESGNVASESGGHNNYMTPIGFQRSGIGLVLNEMPNIRPTRGDDAENRAVTYYVVRGWYGANIANPRNILEVRAA